MVVILCQFPITVKNILSIEVPVFAKDHSFQFHKEVSEDNEPANDAEDSTRNCLEGVSSTKVEANWVTVNVRFSNVVRNNVKTFSTFSWFVFSLFFCHQIKFIIFI